MRILTAIEQNDVTMETCHLRPMDENMKYAVFDASLQSFISAVSRLGFAH